MQLSTHSNDSSATNLYHSMADKFATKEDYLEWLREQQRKGAKLTNTKLTSEQRKAAWEKRKARPTPSKG